MNNFMATDEFELTDEQLVAVSGGYGNKENNSYVTQKNWQYSDAQAYGGAGGMAMNLYGYGDTKANGGNASAYSSNKAENENEVYQAIYG